ncbi:MAG: lamin tail domain-containing protein [Sedimentisphaerales bacterium]|nr:lamin tail domain-containing protein [Sedimentisphaerales bacterium]
MPVLLCNDRWPRNFYAIRRRDPPGGFVFLPWDVEWSLERPQENRLKVTGVENPHLLISKLVANNEFKVVFADHVYRHFFNSGVLTPEGSTVRYLARAGQIYDAIVCESARWGDADRPSMPYTREDWLFATGYLINEYFPVRTSNVLAQIKAQGWYPTIDPPVFQIDGKAVLGPYVRTGAVLTMLNPKGSGTIYYCIDGTDPRVAGTGQVNTSALRYSGPITLKASTIIKARILSGNNWSPLAEAVFVVGPLSDSLRITELMYNPARSSKWAGPGDPDCEFVELANISSQAIKLANIRVCGAVELVLPAVELGPGQCAVIVKDKVAFEAVYGKQVNVVGQYTGSLDNSGQWIGLQDIAGNWILRLRYSRYWAPSTNGSGYSLVLNDPHIDANSLSEPWAWRASAAIGGSPGRLDQSVAVLGAGPVVISEIMYHPYGNPDAEYVELTNISDQAVTLYDSSTRRAWRLTDGGRIDLVFGGKGSIILQPGAKALVVKDLNAFKARFDAPADVSIFQWPDGSLDNAGDELCLYGPVSATTWTMVDHVFYSDGMHPDRVGLARDPWPVAADGCGRALGRVVLKGPGNWVGNWQAIEPGPGR